MAEFATAACIGTGNVGRSWAIVFARSGLMVRLWDSSPAALDTALESIGHALEDMRKAGIITDAPEILSRIAAASSLAEAVENCDWLQESIAENREIKRALYVELDRIVHPHTILASSTSAIPGSQFMTGLSISSRCLVAHPVNPPHIIPLVELCGTPESGADLVERAYAFQKSVGQTPVKIEREIEGFVLNRLQWALLGEAMHLVGEGYCSPTDIDLVLTAGLARRWSFLGPFAVGHLNASEGIAGYFRVLADAIARVQGSLDTAYAPTPEVIAEAQRAMVSQISLDDIAHAQRWRDRRLVDLSHYLSSAETFGSSFPSA